MRLRIRRRHEDGLRKQAEAGDPGGAAAGAGGGAVVLRFYDVGREFDSGTTAGAGGALGDGSAGDAGRAAIDHADEWSGCEEGRVAGEPGSDAASGADGGCGVAGVCG